MHPMQVWQTPYVSDTYAAAQPTGTGPLERIGNAELVRGISDCLSVARMVEEMAPAAATFEALIAACTRTFDQLPLARRARPARAARRRARHRRAGARRVREASAQLTAPGRRARWRRPPRRSPSCCAGPRRRPRDRRRLGHPAGHAAPGPGPPGDAARGPLPRPRPAGRAGRAADRRARPPRARRAVAFLERRRRVHRLPRGGRAARRARPPRSPPWPRRYRSPSG